MRGVAAVVVAGPGGMLVTQTQEDVGAMVPPLPLHIPLEARAEPLEPVKGLFSLLERVPPELAAVVPAATAEFATRPAPEVLPPTPRVAASEEPAYTLLPAAGAAGAGQVRTCSAGRPTTILPYAAAAPGMLGQIYGEVGAARAGPPLLVPRA